MAKDVIVVVQRDALPTTKESLDILLISTTGAQPVGVYRDVEIGRAHVELQSHSDISYAVFCLKK